MTVAIIGTGNMASGLAGRFAAAHVDHTIGARQPAKAAALAALVGSGARTGGLAEAAREADLVILAVPFAAVGDVLAELGDLAGKILIDISNPITPDYMALTIGHTTSAAEEIQKLAPKARVVKAFNTIFAELFSLARPGGAAIQVFYATDEAAAGETVARLIEKIGFAAVNAGQLSNARYLEPVGELNIHFGYALGWGTRIAPAWVKLVD